MAMALGLASSCPRAATPTTTIKSSPFSSTSMAEPSSSAAGGNIAHHVAMQAAGLGAWEQEKLGLGQSLGHVCVEGMILIHPFFTCGDPAVHSVDGGVMKYNGKPSALWCPPPPFARAALPRTLVAIADTDHLRDRGIVYHQALVDAGKDAKLFISENEGHVFFLFALHSSSVPPFLDELSNFINLNSV